MFEEEEELAEQFEAGKIDAEQLVAALKEKVASKPLGATVEPDPEAEELIKEAETLQRQIRRARRRGALP